MTKLEKLILVNELIQADINTEIKSGNIQPINLNSEITVWNKWALNGTILVTFISLIIYASSLK